jgi:hypothetical protein
VFRSTADGEAYGDVELAALGEPGSRALTRLQCERVDFAGGRGLCLRAHRGVLTTYDAVVFDSRFRPLRTIRLPGVPSRTRVRRDGRLAAYTVFVAGHSYATKGFSTRTALVDTATGNELGDLEHFTVRRDGRVFRKVDFNFWGVTFEHDLDRFYATLGTGGKTYLVEGRIRERTIRVIREGVECPSLSPDGKRIAFKERVRHGLGPVTWRIAVLDLATLRARPLAETRNVDDQVEWLDDTHVLYGLAEPHGAITDVWSVRADGTGRPRRFLAGAWSPSIVS